MRNSLSLPGAWWDKGLGYLGTPQHLVVVEGNNAVSWVGSIRVSVHFGCMGRDPSGARMACMTRGGALSSPLQVHPRIHPECLLQNEGPFLPPGNPSLGPSL